MLYCDNLCTLNKVLVVERERMDLNRNIEVAVQNIDIGKRELIKNLLGKIYFVFHFIWALDDYSQNNATYNTKVS